MEEVAQKSWGKPSQCSSFGPCGPLEPQSPNGAGTSNATCKPLGEAGIQCLTGSPNGTQYWQELRWLSVWAYDPGIVRQIRQYARRGELVSIADVLTAQVAEALHHELWNIRGWRHQLIYGKVQYSRHVISCSDSSSFEAVFSGHCMPLLEAFHRFLKKNVAFWSQFSSLAVDEWEIAYPATWYRYGDFAAPHSDTDVGTAGELAFNLHLTKDWDPNTGGSFWFFKHNPAEYHPAFNVLHMFQTQHDSTHIVSPVIYDKDDKRRLAITGWFRGPEEFTPHPTDD